MELIILFRAIITPTNLEDSNYLVEMKHSRHISKKK